MIESRGVWSHIFLPSIKSVPPIFLEVADMNKNSQEGNALYQGLSPQGMPLGKETVWLLAGTSFSTPHANPRQPLGPCFHLP